MPDSSCAVFVAPFVKRLATYSHGSACDAAGQLSSSSSWFGQPCVLESFASSAIPAVSVRRRQDRLRNPWQQATAEGCQAAQAEANCSSNWRFAHVAHAAFAAPVAILGRSWCACCLPAVCTVITG